MAIKGKSKSRGAKGVTRGPKPAYVPVKTPFLRRRGFWIAVGAVVAVGAIAGLWYGFAKQAREDRERETQQRLAAAMTDYGAAVEPVLASVGQALPPADFQAFPSLADALGSVKEGRRLADAETTAGNVSEAAKGAAQAIDGIDVAKIAAGKELERVFVVYLFSSQRGFVEGLELYEQAASLLSLAATANEEQRGDLVATARGVLDLADRVFTRGYADYVEAQSMAGALESGPGAGLPQLPIPTGPTG